MSLQITKKFNIGASLVFMILLGDVEMTHFMLSTWSELLGVKSSRNQKVDYYVLDCSLTVDVMVNHNTHY